MLQQFWTWWTGELASFLPRWDMRKRLLRNARYELCVAPKKVSVLHWKPRASLDGPGAEEGSGPTLQEALTHIHWPSRIVLTLDESMCLRRSAKLPARASTHDNLMLELDVERSTPFRRGSFFSLWKPARADQVSRVVDQAVIRRDYVDDITASLKSKRHRVLGIGIRDADGMLWPMALAGNGEVLGAVQSDRWGKALLASVCLLAASGIGAHSYVQGLLQREIDGITVQQEALQPKALETRNAITKIETELAELTAFQKLQKQRKSPMSLWQEVTRLLPDDTVLQSLSQRGDKITLIGNSAKPEGLIAKLEASPIFTSARFTAPLFRAPQSEMVQFTIELSRESGS